MAARVADPAFSRIAIRPRPADDDGAVELVSDPLFAVVPLSKVPSIYNDPLLVFVTLLFCSVW